MFNEENFPYLTNDNQSALSNHVDSTPGSMKDWDCVDNDEGQSNINA